MTQTIKDLVAERAKFSYLLKLSQEQIRAIEDDDMERVDRILTAKGTLISCLSNAKEASSLDAEIAMLVDQIKVSEEQATQMLEVKLNDIKHELIEIRVKHQARGAYFKFSSIGPHGYDFRRDNTLPRFIDREY